MFSIDIEAHICQHLIGIVTFVGLIPTREVSLIYFLSLMTQNSLLNFFHYTSLKKLIENEEQLP